MIAVHDPFTTHIRKPQRRLDEWGNQGRDAALTAALDWPPGMVCPPGQDDPGGEGDQGLRQGSLRLGNSSRGSSHGMPSCAVNGLAAVLHPKESLCVLGSGVSSCYEGRIEEHAVTI